MNEYAILAKVKNNLILKRILDAGYKNVNDFCAQHQLAATQVGELINMKAPAVDRRGEWRPLALRIADVLAVMPDDLFTPEQMFARLSRNDAYIELSRDRALSLAGSDDMQKAVENSDLLEKLFDRAHLNSRERLVLELRNTDATTSDVAARLGVVPTRVKQIETVAMRKMKAAVSRLQTEQDDATIIEVDAVGLDD